MYVTSLAAYLDGYTPPPPAGVERFYATQTTGHTLPGFNVLTPFKHQNVIFDTGSRYNTTTGIYYTPQATGVIFLSGGCIMDSNPAMGFWQSADGSNWNVLTFDSDGFDKYRQLQAVADLSRGQYFQCGYTFNTSLTRNSEPGDWNFFSAIEVSG